MATFRRIAFAFFALVAVFSAVAGQAAPVVGSMQTDESAIASACHCDGGCDAAACAEMGGCAQACAKLGVFMMLPAARSHRISVADAVPGGLSGARAGHDWPPPLHPPKA